MPLFDTHCHLQDPRIATQLNTLLQHAAAADVQLMLCCATSESDWNIVLDIARQYPATVIPALGIHPWYATDRSPVWHDRLRTLLANPATAVGEIGLDHAISPRSDADQDALFLAQLDLAAEFRRPVSLHCRQAWGSLIEHLQKARRLPPAIVIHSYSGPPEIIPRLLPFNVFFSFSGSLTQPHHHRAHATVPAVPSARLLLETDAPDIDPNPVPDPEGIRPFGPPNEPANARAVAHRIAELRQSSFNEIAQLTWNNARRIFVLTSHDHPDKELE
jgi:TatD DNase family protein